VREFELTKSRSSPKLASLLLSLSRNLSPAAAADSLARYRHNRDEDFENDRMIKSNRDGLNESHLIVTSNREKAALPFAIRKSRRVHFTRTYFQHDLVRSFDIYRSRANCHKSRTRYASYRERLIEAALIASVFLVGRFGEA